ncbi:Uncharacterized protein GBIM_14929, partial [Gryllus bimaculatus]
MARKRRLTLDSERKRRRNEMLPRPRPEQQLGNIASCYEVNCSNNKGRNPDLCFFTFPKDPERCRKWVINSKREDLLQKTSDYTHRNCRLCSNHFEDSQFMNSIKNSLIKTAIPTLFSISNLPKQIFPKTTPAASMDKCLSKRNKLKGAPKMVKNTLNNESGTRRKQSIICRIDDSLILKRGVPKMVKNTSSVESSTRRRKQSIICRKDDCLKAKTEEEIKERQNLAAAAVTTKTMRTTRRLMPAGTMTWTMQTTTTTPAAATMLKTMPSAVPVPAWCECRARTEALRARVWRAEQLLERVLGQLEAEEQRRPDAAAGDGGGERAGDGQRAGADVDTVVLGQPG